jgi:muconolactone delta-isomerase
MSDDSDDPVMQLLATQRAVLGAVENLANQVEAMQAKVDAMSETLAQLVAGSVGAAVPAAKGGPDRAMTFGDRFRAATADEAAADPELAAAQAQLAVMETVIRRTLADNPDAIERVRAEGREQLARLLDQGKTIIRINHLEKIKERGR